MGAWTVPQELSCSADIVLPPLLVCGCFLRPINDDHFPPVLDCACCTSGERGVQARTMSAGRTGEPLCSLVSRPSRVRALDLCPCLWRSSSQPPRASTGLTPQAHCPPLPTLASRAFPTATAAQQPPRPNPSPTSCGASAHPWAGAWCLPLLDSLVSPAAHSSALAVSLPTTAPSPAPPLPHPA